MEYSRRSGLLVLHGNRLELLAEAVFDWLSANPLGPLEAESFLVQSNGMAEWVKMEIASSRGICAATRIELPARFIWRAYRAVLGRGAVPATSALDKEPLTWRLMKLLPECSGLPGFEPVAGFLGSGDPARRLQLARRLADLFDQYQVYRGDWLSDWSEQRDVVRSGFVGRETPVPQEQLWQPALWRAVLQALSPAEQQSARSVLHQRFLKALRPESDARTHAGLPRRVVLFGTTHIPHQTLEAIAALSTRCQVLMAVPNPCRYDWADIIDGRELLRAERRRQQSRAGLELSRVPLQDMHAHGHPLLAAWGRQGRDFIRQLDAFDDVQLARQQFDIPKVDLFDEAPGCTLLEQVQAAIRDLVPLDEHPKVDVSAGDRSIVFHVAHSAQREVEILHDQLLHLFAQAASHQPLRPRDVVVMVPDIDAFAPAIRSVFGQYGRGHARHIPWGIADLKSRGHQPMLVALEWLLRSPQQRFGASEVRDLLDVPAVAHRIGLATEDLPILASWIEGAGIRWGLDAAQRDSIGLGAAGEQNTWVFGMRRMLLGYATGELSSMGGFGGVEPYTEVAGLSAGLAGALAEFLRVLLAWRGDAGTPRTPSQWGERLRSLLVAVFRAGDDEDRAVVAALEDALGDWLESCEAAGFDEAVDLAVVREAWLDAVDEPGVSRRFKAGGVTFCTLLPMRAIPFEVVCLLGMNDTDYPRRGSRSDFDLMASPGQVRPGDRSRRDDDRQLMLDALLSARRVLYVSWAGRSQRDNQEQPPSVLVSQLRDYLTAGWGPDVLGPRTTEHPLQPFSRKYFEPDAAREQGSGLITYAAEWRSAHADPGERTAAVSAGLAAEAIQAADGPAAIVTIDLLTRFLRNPVKEFFRQRLQVNFGEFEAAAEDDEPFALDKLEEWSQMDEVLKATQAAPEVASAADSLRSQVARLKRAGRLPMAGSGQLVESELIHTLLPVWSRWLAAQVEFPQEHERQPLRMQHLQEPGLVFDDWLLGLRGSAEESRPVWIELQASKVAEKVGKSGSAVREYKLLSAWVRCLASAACGCPADGIVIGPGAAVHVTPPEREQALSVIADLMQACRDGLAGDQPLPTAVRTGIAYLQDAEKARNTYDGSDFNPVPGEGKEACLARLYPDFEALSSQSEFEAACAALYRPFLEWLGGHAKVELLEAVESEEEGACLE